MNTITSSVVKRMGVEPLWDRSYFGQGVAVAVIDSGLAPRVSFEDNVICDLDFTGEDRARHKDNYHGGQVASCVNLIARDAGIANLRVVSSDNNIKRSSVIEALQFCIDNYPKFKIVNISLSFTPRGCPEECPLCRKLEEAYCKGIFVIVAAGNKGPREKSLTCPAKAKWAIANVATWTPAEDLYWKKHWAKRIWHTYVTGQFGRSYGTSFSAGYSSGGAALLFSAFPKLTSDTLRFAILETDKQLNDEAGHQTTLNFDRVYDCLLGLRKWSEIGVDFYRNGALRPRLEPF